MARWVVLEDYDDGRVRYPAGTVLDDATIDLPALQRGGLAVIGYTPALDPYRAAAQALRGTTPVVKAPEGDLTALLLAAGVFGGAGGVITFRPGAPAFPPTVYDDWAQLMEAVRQRVDVGASVRIECDLRLVGGTYALPAGTWDFGGKAVLAGSTPSPAFPSGFQATLVCGDGVKLTGLVQITQILSIVGAHTDGEAVIDLESPNGFLLLTLGAGLVGLTGPVVRPAGGFGLIVSIVSGGIQAAGPPGPSAPAVDIPGGSGLQIVAIGPTDIGIDAISGSGIFARNITSLGTGAINLQGPQFTGSYVWDAGSINLAIARFSAADVGNTPSATLYLPIVGDTPSATDDWPLRVPPIFSPKLVGFVSVAWTGAGVGDPLLIELLVDGVVVASGAIPIAAPAGNIGFLPPSGGVVLPSNSVISVRATTPAIWTSSPTELVVTLLGIA